MREAIGSTLLLKLGIVFLIVFTGFLAIALHYGKTFRIKNALVNYIEQKEGIKDISAFNAYAKKLGYETGKKPTVCYYDTSKGYYYKVSVNIMFRLPLLKDTLDIPITGETRIIETGSIDPKTVDGMNKCT